jgi:hypothetical protein
MAPNDLRMMVSIQPPVSRHRLVILILMPCDSANDDPSEIPIVSV